MAHLVSPTSTIVAAVREIKAMSVLEPFKIACRTIQNAFFVDSLKPFTDPVFAVNNGSNLFAQFDLVSNLLKCARFENNAFIVSNAHTTFRRFLIVSSIFADVFGTKRTFYIGAALSSAIVGLQVGLQLSKKCRGWIGGYNKANETLNNIKLFEKIASLIIASVGILFLYRGKTSLYGISQIAFNFHNALR